MFTAKKEGGWASWKRGRMEQKMALRVSTLLLWLRSGSMLSAAGPEDRALRVGLTSASVGWWGVPTHCIPQC